MKWFIRLSLLLGLFLFGKTGLYAGSGQHGYSYSGIKYHLNLIDGTLGISHQQQHSYAPPIQGKGEYQKIKDATEEDDDDRKSLRQKKRKSLESNTGKYTLNRPPVSPQIINPYCFTRRKSTPSSSHFFYAKSYRLYHLFQVFRI